jgi:hypothetical protein
MSHLISNLALLMAAVSAAYLLFKAIQSISSKKPCHKDRSIVDRRSIVDLRGTDPTRIHLDDY